MSFEKWKGSQKKTATERNIMSVKTFTLATIIYPTLSSLKITSPALVKMSRGGGVQGTWGSKIFSRKFVFWGQIEAGPRLPISSLVNIYIFNLFYLTNNFLWKMAWSGMSLKTTEENIHDSKTNKLTNLSLSWITHLQDLYKKVFMVLPLLSDINDVH